MKNRTKWITAAAVVFWIAAGIMMVISIRKRNMENLSEEKWGSPVVFYEEGGKVYFSDGTVENTVELTSNNSGLSSLDYMCFTLSPDQHYLAYPKAASYGNYSLGLLDMDDPSHQDIKVDTKVSSFSFAGNNSDLLFYSKKEMGSFKLGDSSYAKKDFYVYDIQKGESKKILSGVFSPKVDEEGEYVLYWRIDGTFCRTTIDGDVEVLEESCGYIYEWDFWGEIPGAVCYVMGDSLYVQIPGEEKKEIAAATELITACDKYIYFISDGNVCCYNGKQADILVEDYRKVDSIMDDSGTFVVIQKETEVKYIIRNGKTVKAAVPATVRMITYDRDLTHVYYVDEVDNELNGILYEMNLRSGKVSVMDHDVYVYSLIYYDGLGIRYMKRSGPDLFVTDLYLNGELVTADAVSDYYYGSPLETLYVVGDYNKETRAGTLYAVDAGKVTVVADDVYMFSVLNNGSIAILTKQEGTLYMLRGKEKIEISMQVYFLINNLNL